MKNKFFIALIISMTLIMTSSLIVLAVLQTNTQLPISTNPETIKVYYKSQTEVLTYTNEESEYSEIIKLYNDSFKKSYLKQITTNQFLGDGVAEAVDQKPWDNQNKIKGLFVEFTYSTNQRLVINRNGNTRQVFISSIIFELTQEKEVHKIYLHYAEEGKYNNKKESSDEEDVYPLQTEGDTRELYIYLRGLIDEKKNSD